MHGGHGIDPVLKALMHKHGITQTELADGIGRTQAYVSRLASGEAEPSKETIDSTLAFLATRLRRRVTYEEVFGSAREVSA